MKKLTKGALVIYREKSAAIISVGDKIDIIIAGNKSKKGQVTKRQGNITNNKNELFLPPDTIMGALQRYTITENKNYQPMNANFGLIDIEIFDVKKRKKMKKLEKRKFIANNSLKSIVSFIKRNKLNL